MADVGASLPPERFCPEVRGWAALRMTALVPRTLREEVERRATMATAAAARLADEQGGAVSAARPCDHAAHPPPSQPRQGALLVSAALTVVSMPASIAWSREIAERIPALGPAAGPACLARLWVARLLRPGGDLGTFWPGVVDAVWNVILPILERLGIDARGHLREELRHEVASPLALVLLASLAAGRKDFRLIGAGPADGPDGPPFGWAPGIDAITPLIRYLVAGQVPGGFKSHALLSSPLARLLRASGMAMAVTAARRRCCVCRTWIDRAARPSFSAGGLAAGQGDGLGLEQCPHCGGPLTVLRTRRLVAAALFYQAPGRTPGLELPPERRAPGETSGGGLTAHQHAEAIELRRACLRRSLLLWRKVIRCGHNVSAMVVLGVLAGVRPLTLVADRPAPQRPWLESLVDVLTEERLDREGLVAAVNAALPAVAGRLGRPAPPVRSANIGVLATRFRQAIFRPQAGGTSPAAYC